MRSKKFVACSVVVATLFVVAVPTSAITLWEENFESYAAGTQIGTTAKWLDSPDEGLMINGYYDEEDVSSVGHRLDPDGMALDGNSHKEQGVTGRLWSVARATIPGPATNSELVDVTVSFDAIVQRGSNSNGTANSGLYLEIAGGLAEFGLHFSRANGKGWGFINGNGTDGRPTWAPVDRGLSGTSEYAGEITTGGVELGMTHDNGIWHAVNSPTTASITLDKATMLATATVGGYDFTPQPFTQNVWDNLHGFRIRNDINGVAHHDANFGIDIDNIRVTSNTATDFTWKGGSGDWGQATNWTPGGSPGNGMATLSDETVLFGGASGATSTIFTDSQVDINQIQFDNETASHLIVGSGGVNMIATTEDTPVEPSVKVLAGDHTFQTPFSISDDTTITVDSGSLTFDNQVDLAGHMLTLSGTTTFNHSVVDSVGGGSVVLLSGEVSGLGAISVVPEPASLALVVLAGFFGLVCRQNRKAVL